MRRLLAIALGCAALGARAPIPIQRPAPPLDVVVPGTLLARAESLPFAHKVRTLADGRNVFEFEGTPGQTVAMRDAMLDEGIDVELDLYRQGQAGPNDEGYPRQWPLTLLKALDAWKVTTGDPALTVAVVDTGFIDHPDFVGRLATGYDFITDVANAGDGDARDGDAHDAGTEDESSSSFHGPHVSGIIGAASNNGIGMAGVDWNCRLLPVRVLGVKRHRGKDSDISDGIRWAAGLNVPGVPQNKTPARIINLSFGGPGFSRVLQDAINAAMARGVMIIGSAGNNSEDANINVPGALEGVISVAAATPDGKLAGYSNYGPRVDFMAPGGASFIDAPVGEERPEAIWSTSYLRSTAQPVFAYQAGTSQAAAYATGVAALVRAVAPSLPPEVVGAVMRRASVMPAGGCELGCGAGLLDASRAVAYAKQIEAIACVGCGATNDLKPAPRRPEEGCAVGASRGGGGYAVFVVIGLLLLRRRRVLGLGLGLGLGLVSCGTAGVERESTSQATPTITVKITDPIPTFDNGELSISIGEGREVEAKITPSTGLDRVELVMIDDATVLGRLARAPFRFSVPSWVLGEAGRRQLCITAYDARGNRGESCFQAVR